MLRTIIVSISLLALSISSSAQNLTFDEVLSLRKKSLSGVEEYLNSKGWAFLQATEPDNKSGSVTFTYKKSYINDNAQSFITYYYSDFSNKKIKIQVVKKDVYNSYLTRIRSLGMRMINSEIENGELIKVYQGKTTTAKLSIFTQQDDYSDSRKTGYQFLIMTNEDYKIMEWISRF